ncbi:MAG: CRISPR-associated ring nuclease [Candidatus Micrarchaeota archaeon]|nr:CRISPR-associated ring nuclease [Candidatus Micrarchaeota archaeon]
MPYALICTLGKSPPVVTEVLDYLNRARQLPRELHLIVSSDEKVLAGKILIEQAIKQRYRFPIKVYEHKLKEEDVVNKKVIIKLMKYLIKLVEEIRGRQPIGEIYALLSGGRKTEIVGFYSVAQIAGINIALHVHSYSVEAINEKLERHWELIKELAKADRPEKFYSENKKIFDEICFPDPSTYEVIEVPLIPIPKTYVIKLRQTLLEIKKSNKSWNEILKIVDADLLEQLKKLGYFEEIDGKLKLKERGVEILEILGD